MKHCIACGGEVHHNEMMSLCGQCTYALRTGFATSVINNIEARYTERIADLEQLLEEYKQENEEHRLELNRLEARILDCRCGEVEMIDRYERIPINVPQDDPHHSLCECGKCSWS